MTTTIVFDVSSAHHSQMIDMTRQIQDAVDNVDVKEGQVTIFIPHTTAAVTINENADPAVTHDMLAALDRVVPWRQDDFRPDEGNSAAHLKSSLVGCSITIPVTRGRMALGTWQGIYFCEFDGPRRRQTIVSISGK